MEDITFAAFQVAAVLAAMEEHNVSVEDLVELTGNELPAIEEFLAGDRDLPLAIYDEIHLWFMERIGRDISAGYGNWRAEKVRQIRTAANDN